MINRRGVVFGLLNLAFTGVAHARLSDDIDNFEDAISKLSRKYSTLSPSEIAKFKKNFAVHFVIIDTKTVKDGSAVLEDSVPTWRIISQMMAKFEFREMILSFDDCSMKYGVRQMAKFAKKYWDEGELDAFTIITFSAANLNKRDETRPSEKPPLSGLGKNPYESLWSVGNTDGRAFSLETDPYSRVREVMEAAFDSFLQKKHKQRLKGIYVPGSLPKAENADGLGCLVS